MLLYHFKIHLELGVRTSTVKRIQKNFYYLKKECYWTRPNIFDLRCLYFVGENDKKKKGEEIFTLPDIVIVHLMHKFCF